MNQRRCHAVENIVLQNRQVNAQQIADTVCINTGSVKMVLQEHLQMTEVCVRWILNCMTRK